MYFDENTAKAIDVANNALRRFVVGALADYEIYIDWSDTRHQIVQIKSIVLGEYTKGFWGYKNIVIPSLMVENIETNEVFDVVKFQEGGWHEWYGKKSYSHPEIWPFAALNGGYRGAFPPKPSDSSYSANHDISLTILSKLEAKKMLEDKIAMQAAAQEDARRAALLAQQQQRELQRQNDAIKDSDIAALLNKYKNNR